MKSIILKESELKEKFSKIYEQEQIKILEEKWNKLSKNEKLFVVEFLIEIYPDKAKLLKESKWYNTLGDIAGIFDPTGVVDIVNGLSYWKQGDHLFALLSWISALPIIGDVIGKSVVGVFKTGGIVGKEFKVAMAAGDAAKMASTASKSGPLKTLLRKAPEWGGRLLEMLKKFINKIPFVRRIIPIVEDYIKLFKGAGAEMKVVGKVGKEAETVFKGFRDFAGVKNNWFKYMKSEVPLWNKLNAGSFRIFGGNPATRSLMRRSKWYLGFLDTIGLANTVGPEEIESKVPDFEKKLDEYNRSEEGKRNAAEDSLASSETTSTAPPPPPTSTETNKTDNKKDIVSGALSTIFPELKMLF